MRWFIVLLLFVFCGCRTTTTLSSLPPISSLPKVAGKENLSISETPKVHIHEWDLETSLCKGCAEIYKPMVKEKIDTERDLLLKSFSDSGIILKSFEKEGLNIFDIASFLNDYGKEDIEGFCEYLATQHPFKGAALWYLDREFFIPAKRNHELLRRLNESEERTAD